MTDGSALGLVAAWPGKGSVAGWVRRDSPPETTGDLDAPFWLASVTKLLSTAAVLVATEEEILGLDEPAGPPHSTVRLLLCHASGLPFDGTTQIAAPGRRRIYGNAAFELLGDLVAARANLPFADYVHEAVCLPLEMTSTVVPGSPAHSGRSTLRDLLRFCCELLEPGRVLAPATLAEAMTPQLPELAGVLPGFGRQDPNPWGLGFEVHGHKSPHWMPASASPGTVGHFGQSGTFLWMDPVPGVACVGLAAEPFGPWAIDAWPALGAAVLDPHASAAAPPG